MLLTLFRSWSARELANKRLQLAARPASTTMARQVDYPADPDCTVLQGAGPAR